MLEIKCNIIAGISVLSHILLRSWHVYLDTDINKELFVEIEVVDEKVEMQVYGCECGNICIECKACIRDATTNLLR